VAVVAALAEEVAPLRARLRDVRPATLGPLRLWRGRLDGRRVVLAVTGDGERNAREGSAALLAALPVRQLVAIGVAGGVSPGLVAGALVLAEEVRGAGRPSLRAPGDVEGDARAAGAGRGVVVTVDRLVDSVAAKQRLLVEHGDAARVVVDLESALYAAAAERAGVPWAVLRAVSDTAAEPVPALLNRCRDGGGAIRRLRVLGSMLAEPGAVPVLLRLRRRLGLCAERLAEATMRLVGQRGCTTDLVFGGGS
jgi:nucleoside phosphorylase